ncbi:MAG: hypothetical protein FWF73_04555 [Spirochaetes bacterium]|nr:hypothetical protein [Spirochaetota bacterium]
MPKKPPLPEEKKTAIATFLQAYDIKSAEDFPTPNKCYKKGIVIND